MNSGLVAVTFSQMIFSHKEHYTTYLQFNLRTISGIVHAHHFCGGKQGKLSGSCLSTIYDIRAIQFSEILMSDGYFHIFWTK